MKVFKYPFLFLKAFRATKREMLVSVVILIIITLLLAYGLYYAEARVRSDFSYFDALVWNFVKYVEDPAEVATGLVTTAGKVFGTLVGVMGVAIFAVPAGLVGSGLIDAMKETRHEKKIEEASVRLHKRFRRIAQHASWFYNEKKMKKKYTCVPVYRSLVELQVKTGLKTDDLIEAVANCPDMRLVNLASCDRPENHPQDRIAVVHFPLNREYGCCLDRGSDVTIVAPVAVTETGTGNFAFSLAAMGGFNYVSKEISPNPDDPFGFYSMKKSNLELIDDYDKKEDVESQALHFLHDLRALKERSERRDRRHWFVFVMASTKAIEWHVHLWRLATDSAKKLPQLEVDDPTNKNKSTVTMGSTVTSQDESVYQSIANDVRERLGKRTAQVNNVEQRIVTVVADTRKYLQGVGAENVMCRVGGGKDCNAFTLRMAFDLLVFNAKHLLLAKDIADAIKTAIEPDRDIPEEARRCYLKEGDGFADEYGKEDVFLSSPEKLKEMIEQQKKLAREQFEKYDLDGNIQANFK